MTRRSYTSAGPLEPFELDGVEFQPVTTFEDLLAFERRFGGVEVATIEGMAALLELFKAMLGDGWDRFNQHVRAHGTRPEMLFEIFMDVLRDAYGGPTPPPPEGPGPVGGSANGHAGTGPTSSGGSYANLDLGLLTMLAQHRATTLDPDRAEALRAAVARVESELAGSPPG